MRRLRSALLFALCVVLPFAGSAGGFAAPSRCAAGHGAHAGATGKAADRCCERHRPADAGGASCKAGHDCTCAVPGLPQVTVASLPPPSPMSAAIDAWTRAADIQPVAVWRPPTYP
jgi:hypothetical protein